MLERVVFETSGGGRPVVPQGAREVSIAPARRRGRPIEMAPEDVLARIRTLAGREEGLFRVHVSHPALYARARRLFGSWEGAVRASGLNDSEILAVALPRSLQSRKRRPRRAFVTLP